MIFNKYAGQTNFNYDGYYEVSLIDALEDISKSLAYAKYCSDSVISINVNAKPTFLAVYSTSQFEDFIAEIDGYIINEFLADTYTEAFINEFDASCNRSIILNMDFGWTSIKYTFYCDYDENHNIIGLRYKVICPNRFYDKLH